MKSVLISIQPKWCELIASGKKTVEVRKTRPKLETPFKCYIYCTQARKPIREDGRILLYEDDLAITNRWGRGKKIENPHGCLKEGELLLNGKVIGEFVCDKVDRIAHCGTCKNDIRLNIVDKNFYCKALGYEYLNKCKLSYSEIEEYSNGGDVYGWHISNLVIYDKPKELGEFRKPIDCHRGKDRENCKGCWDCEITRPPQSWMYCESEVSE